MHLWLCAQLSKAALLRIAHGLAAALQPWMSHLECSSCGSRTATLWCEGRSCRETTGRDCSGTFQVKDHAFPSLRSWTVQAAEQS
ncbi:g3999 [Coccomyxa viridis]|uniref:G3999 protein n=1 Tax=Coccomyxa viridis TaxID=1274662 RepID=A0ABP1FP51_9CHLO